MATRKATKISVFEVIADSSLTGGPKHVLTLMSGLNRRKFVPTVVCPPGPLVSQLEAIKVPVFQVPMEGKADLNAVNAIAKILRKYQPDIVHTHGQRGGLIGRLASRTLPVRRLHTEHTFTKELKYDSAFLHWTHLRAMKVLDRYTHKIIAVSNAVKKFLIDSGVSKADKITTIYNGIKLNGRKVSDKEIQQARDQYGIQKSDIVIGSAGSFNKSKDTATLIKAFAKVHAHWPKAKLVLMGAGELQRGLEQLVHKLELEERVVFTGAIESPLPVMKTFNLFILPSIAEPFGIVLLEAMKMEVPIISTRVGGIPEIITNNYNGLLVKPGDPKLLAATILKLLNDKQLQKKFLRHYPEVLKKFSDIQMVTKTEEIYTSLVG